MVTHQHWPAVSSHGRAIKNAPRYESAQRTAHNHHFGNKTLIDLFLWNGENLLCSLLEATKEITR